MVNSAPVNALSEVSHEFPPLPPNDTWKRTRPLDFEYTGRRWLNGVSWPFSSESWNLLLHFLSKIRVPHGEDIHRVPRVTCLEFYVCFVVANGGGRFRTDLPQSMHGHWIFTQMDKWNKALHAFQKTVAVDLFYPMQITISDKDDTWKTVGFPPQPMLTCQLLLPHLQKAKRLFGRRFRVLLIRRVNSLFSPRCGEGMLLARLTLNASTLILGLSIYPLPWNPLPCLCAKLPPPRWYQSA